MSVEAGFTPNGEQFAEGSETGQPGSAVDVVRGLIQQQELNLGDIGNYYDEWINLQSESAGYIPQSVTTSIRNVSIGLGFLFYNQWGEMGHTGRSKQGAFQKRLQRWYEEYQGELVLTHEEGIMLRDAAAAVNVAYDPGEPEDTPENIQKRTFNFADLEQRALYGDMPEPGRVVDAEQ